MTKQPADVIIIGGGILGCATARQILKNDPSQRVVVLEKEGEVAKHQTGHNSGVIHSGIYYKPGSLKAQNSVQGAKLLKAYCQEYEIPYEECGKVIVATEEEELPRLEELHRRGCANGVEGLEMVCPKRLREIEPNANGLMALYSPKTAIVDFCKVTEAYVDEIRQLGGEVCLSHPVETIRREGDLFAVVTLQGTFQSRFVINCSGVFADRLAHTLNQEISAKQIVPFRGEYYELKQERRNLVKGLIYPVPDPKLPFLGVHMTRMIDGRVEAGPNAVLALSREGYTKTCVNWRDVVDIASYSGVWKMAKKYWKVGLYEQYRSLSKRAFLKSLQRLVPCLQSDDLITGRAGVRPQVIFPDGQLSDDFVIEKRVGIINVLNAPSPAATASLAIGEQLTTYYEQMRS